MTAISLLNGVVQILGGRDGIAVSVTALCIASNAAAL